MKILLGKVISKKMDKSVIVLVTKKIKHYLYKKYIFKSTKYCANDEYNLCRENDFVLILNVKPISKTKFWKVIKFIF